VQYTGHNRAKHDGKATIVQSAIHRRAKRDTRATIALVRYYCSTHDPAQAAQHA